MFPSPALQDPSRAPAPCRILYIDDDAAMRRLVERDLQRHGYRIALAKDGPAGEARAREGGFDLICLDHYMPGQDGLETLARLRAMPDLPPPGLPPVVFVTGSEEGKLAMAALRGGAVAYVIKEAGGEFLPLLRVTIDDALEREHLRRAKDQALRDLQEARDRAEELAAQRAMLLREVNHRVANSLQLIASFTLLQEGGLADEAARAALAEIRSRVFAVAQVHRRLYTSDDPRRVELDEYFAGLLAELGRSIGDAPDRIRLDFTGAPLRVDTDKAVPLGVILAELVTNAIKYAYPEGQGAVRVSLRDDGGEGVLRVEDDGIGYGNAARPGSTGLGRQVIRAMADSMGARVIRCDRSAGVGVCMSVHFPLDAASCRV